MRTRSIVILFALAMLVPLLARAERRGGGLEKGRIAATKTAIANLAMQHGLVPPNASVRYTKKDVRISTKVDKAHFADHHQHVQGHTPRLVTWSIPALGLSGTAYSDTIHNMGANTQVSKFKADPPPWSLPSQAAQQ